MQLKLALAVLIFKSVEGKNDTQQVAQNVDSSHVGHMYWKNDRFQISKSKIRSKISGRSSFSSTLKSSKASKDTSWSSKNSVYEKSSMSYKMGKSKSGKFSMLYYPTSNTSVAPSMTPSTTSTSPLLSSMTPTSFYSVFPSSKIHSLPGTPSPSIEATTHVGTFYPTIEPTGQDGSSLPSTGSSRTSVPSSNSPTSTFLITNPPSLSPSQMTIWIPSTTPTLEMITNNPSQSQTVLPSFKCDVGPTERRKMMLSVLTADNNVTSIENINMIGSSSNLAFEWLVGEDELYLCPDDPNIIQRYVLAKLYFNTNGNEWIHCSRKQNATIPECSPTETSPEGSLQGENWLSASNECEWAFIRCRSDKNITHIEVGKSSILYFLFRITLIFEKDENFASGALITEIDWLFKLEVFTMDGSPNKLTGTIPSQFGNIPNLRILDLDENSLTGTIPEEIYINAKNLQQFDLDSNLLTGTISTLIGTLTQLNFFQLFNNPISGTFPSAELSQLTNLSKLYL